VVRTLRAAPLTDAISLQGELAVEIAHALRANLTLAEKTNLATRPTENLDAYILYLRARELETRFGAEDADSEAAINLYQQALDLDPNFALARARLSIAISSLTQGEDLSRKAKAQTEAEEALHRRPDLGEASWRSPTVISIGIRTTIAPCSNSRERRN
jgi:hypothetical protein